MNRKFMVLLFFQIFALVFLSYAQEEEQDVSQVVYFDEYINNVITTLPDIQLNRLKSIDSEVQLLKALKQKEWNLEVRGGGFQESDFTGNIESPFVFQTGWEMAATLNKTFVNIGGRMNLDFTYRQFTAKGIVDGVTEESEFFVPTLTFQYAQPLLKNAFGMLDRLPVSLAGLEKKIADWTNEEENSYLLSNYKKIYMQWVVYDQIREFLYESLDNAKDLERISIQQKNIGYIDDVDFQNTKMLSLQIENELLDVETTYTNLLMQISYMANSTNIIPNKEEWNIFIEAVNNENFQGIPFKDTRQSLILTFLQDKLAHSGRGLKNSRLPELNLLLTAAMEVYSTNSSSRGNEFILVPAYYAGLQFRYPLGDMDYKANARELFKKKQEYQFLVKKYQNEFNYDIQEKERNLNFYREKINNRIAVRDALNKRYLAQYQKFKQGRETLAGLIDTKNKLLNNRIEEADVQLRLIFEYFDFLVMVNKDEISLGY